MAILSTESVSRGGREWVKHKIFNDESVDETTSSAVDVRGASAICLVIETSSTVSSGVVDFEAALSSDYSGTWDQITQVTLTAGGAVSFFSVDSTSSTGVPVGYVRARISTNVQNGTIDAYILVQY